MTVFATAIYWRTRLYLTLLAPLACLTIVVVEYYNLKRRGHLRRCEEAERRVEEVMLMCGYRNGSETLCTIVHVFVPLQNHNRYVLYSIQ